MSGSMTGGVDSSIPLQAKAPPPINPLAQIGEFANIQNALNQARLFPTLQQSAQVGLAQKNNQAVYGSMIPMLQDPNLTLDRITQHLAGLEGSGLMTHAPINEIQNLPGTPNSPEWQRAVKTMIAARAQVDPMAAIAQAVGTPIDQDTGLTIQSGIRAPAYVGGGITPSTATQVYPSRAALAGRIAGPPDASGAPTTVPLATGTPSELSGLNMGTGRVRDAVPPALRNPNAPPPANSGLPGQITTGLGPAETANKQASGANAAAAFQNITNEGVKARSQDAILANMQNDLTQFTSGSGADRALDFNRALVSWAPPLARALNIDPKAVAANESFNKLASQIADAQGAGSDARLAVTQAANPAAHLSPEGADFIVRQLRGNTDYLKARQALASQYPDQTDNRGFEANVASGLDPRVFQYARLTPEQRGTYYNAIDKNDRPAFKKAWKYATDNGVLGGG